MLLQLCCDIARPAAETGYTGIYVVMLLTGRCAANGLIREARRESRRKNISYFSFLKEPFMLVPFIALILVAIGVVTYLIMQANRKTRDRGNQP